MKTIDIKNNLKNAVEKTTPDCFEKVLAGKYSEYAYETVRTVQPKKSFAFRKVFAMVACVLFIALGLGSYFTPVNSVFIDINPSVEIKANIYDRVLELVGRNDDGDAFAYKLNARHKTINEVIDAIMAEMIADGYVDPAANNNAILISIQAINSGKSTDIYNKVDTTLTNVLKNNNTSAVVMRQDINNTSNAQAEKAQEAGVSISKLQLIEKIMKLDDDDLEIVKSGNKKTS